MGNRRVTFFETPGHTPGSICLHDENTNYLFVCDCGANGGILLNLPMSLSAETALETAEKILAFVDEHGIDTIYPGHAPIGIRPDIFRKQAQGCRELMEGKASDKDLAKGEYYVDGYKFQFCDIASMGFLSEAYLDIRYETGEGYADYVQLSDLVEQGKASPEQLEVWQALQEIREQLRGVEYLTQGMEQYRDRVIGGIDFSRLYTMFQSVTDLDYWDYSPGIDVVSLEEIPQE